jgi:autotransporter-associated beta strand protein
VPGASDSADIPAAVAYLPSLNADPTVQNLTIESGATLSLAGQSLTVTGTFINQGTLILQGNEAVSLVQDTSEGTWEYVGDGTGGSLRLQDFGTTDYYNLVIDDANAAPDTFQAAAPLSVAGSFQIESGTYAANTQPTNVSGMTTVAGTYQGSTGLQGLSGGLTLEGGTVTTDPAGQLSLGGGITTQPSGTMATLGGKVDLGGVTRTFQIAPGTTSSGVDLSVTAQLSNGGATLAGGGTLALAGTNTYAAGTTIEAGTLELGNIQALGTGPVTLNDGNTGASDTALVASVSSGSSSIANPITVANNGSGTSTLGTTAFSPGDSTATTFSGAVTLDRDTTFQGGNAGGTTWSGTISSPSAVKLTITSASGSGGAKTHLTNQENDYSGTLDIAGTGTDLEADSRASSISGFGGNGTGWTTYSSNSQVITGKTSYMYHGYSYYYYAYGPAGPMITNNALTIICNNFNDTSSAFMSTPVSIAGGFTASFTETVTGLASADGMAFVVQDSPHGAAAVGGLGNGLGYVGITKSLAVGFNMYQGLNAPGILLGLNGSLQSPAKSIAPLKLNSGDPIAVSIAYNANTQVLSVDLTDTTTSATAHVAYTHVDLATLLGGSTAYVGFTGGTGGLTSTQTISGFQFDASSSSVPRTESVDVGAGGTFQVDGSAMEIDALTGVGTVQGGDGGATLAVGSNGGSGTFSGVLQDGPGTLALTMAGSGTETLEGANTYSGGTTIDGGNLLVSDGGLLGTGLVTDNADLVLAPSGGLTMANAIGGSGNVSIEGGTVTLAGTNTYTGLTNLYSGLLNLQGPLGGSLATASGTMLEGGGAIAGSLSVGGTINFTVNAPAATPGADYNQFVVGGPVNLSGATLSVHAGAAGNVVPGEVVTLIANNSGSAASTDSHTSPADGAVLPLAGENYTLSYAGGRGNDVVLIESPMARTFAINTSASATAGQDQAFSITAEDLYGHTATGYTGTVHFTSTDGQAVLPASYTFTPVDQGVHSFTVQLRTAGTQSVRVTDTVHGSVTGVQAGIAVAAGAASTLAITGMPSSVTAGQPARFTLTARDAYNNIATGYTGTVHFGMSYSDPLGTLPADYTFASTDAGRRSFVMVLTSAGVPALSETDTGNHSLVANSSTVVNPSTAVGMQVSTSSSMTAGSQAGLFVTVLDAYGNTVTGYAGTVHLTSTDTKAVLPADYTFVPYTGNLFAFPRPDFGRHYFNVTLQTSGTQVVRIRDTAHPTVTVTATIVVSPASASALAFSSAVPASATAGSAFTLVAKAVDPFGNTATAYTGTVHLTSTDGQASLPADYTFSAGDNGLHAFRVVLETVGTRSVTITDTSNAGLSLQAGGIAVSAGSIAGFAFAYTATTVAGLAHSFTVTAADSYGNTITGYTGTVHFTSSDSHATLPADYTFTPADQGVHTFTATLATAGSKAIRVADALHASLTHLASGITVTPASAARVVVSGFPTPTTAGTPGTVTVTLFDAFGNVATGYTGTVHLSTDDTTADLPADWVFTSSDASTHTFTVTFHKSGTHYLKASDTNNSTLAGLEGGIVVQ